MIFQDNRAYCWTNYAGGIAGYGTKKECIQAFFTRDARGVFDRKTGAQVDTSSWTLDADGIAYEW